MRRAPLVSVCTVAALALAGLLPAAAAQPSDRPAPDGSRPDVPAARTVAAQRTLDAVEAAFTGDNGRTGPGRGLSRGRDLTLLLRDLRVQLPALRADDRDRAQAWLARPTDGRNDPYGDGYGAPGQDDCGAGEPGAGSAFCIHWVPSTDDAPPLTDTNPANRIPDQVDRTRETMERVWAREILAAGYREPLRDAGDPDAGPTRALDIYLSNIGGQGLYGYCATEPAPGNGRDFAAFCVLDEDYASSQFPSNTPLENLQVTAAHEFFHAVQFAYDALEDTWLMEGTATWMEDEVYDGVDDNLFYLESSPLTQPQRPVDKGTGLYVYGAWLWWRYLSEQHGADGGTGIPTLIRRIWEEADDADADRPGTYSLKAARRILANRGSSLTSEFAGFGLANRRPRAFYEEGERYPAAPVADSTRLSAADTALPERAVRLDHLSTQTFAFTPGSGLTEGRWRLRARVDAPAAKHRPLAHLTGFRSDSTVVTKRLDLNRDGIGRATVSFDSDVVERVELTLANAGQRFDCGLGTVLSCEGASLSDDRPFAYRIRLRP